MDILSGTVYIVLYKQADDVSGSAWTDVSTSIDAELPGGQDGVSLATIGGLPAIAYGQSQENVLKYKYSTDADGTTWQAGQSAGEYFGPELYDFAGRPLVCLGPGPQPNFQIADVFAATTWSGLINPKFTPSGSGPFVMLQSGGLQQYAFVDNEFGFVDYAIPLDDLWSAFQVEPVPGTGDCTALQIADVNSHPAVAFTGSTSGQVGYSVFH
jgi:hypothetical protein